MATRKSCAPHVTAYWFTLSLIAAAAARFKSAGAGKFGNPCERLTAPALTAPGVISRTTDSVNGPAFCETRPRFCASGVAMRAFLRTELRRCSHRVVTPGKRARTLTRGGVRV